MLSIASILLDRGRSIDNLSRGLTIASFVGFVGLGILTPNLNQISMWLLGAACVGGLAEAWFAARVALDASLFQQLSRNEDGPDWSSFDDAMMTLRLMPASKAGRPAAARIAGAFRLFAFQVTAFLAQAGLLGAAAVAGAIR